MLGVITEVTLQCVDAFNLEEKLVYHTLDYCLENLDNLTHGAEYVKMWVELHSQSCYLFSQHKTNKEPTFVPCYLEESIKVGVGCWLAAMATEYGNVLYGL